MFENPDNFQVIVVHLKKILMRTTPKQFIILLIESKDFMKLQGIEIDHNLLVDKHIAS